MSRWIVFDQITASELRSRLPHESVFEAPGRAALEYALDNPRSMVTVLPVSGNCSTIAVFRPGRTLITDTEPANTLPVRPTGILGLNDTSVLGEMREEPRRWWQFWKE